MAIFPALTIKPNFPMDPDGELEDVVLKSKLEGGYQLTRPRTTRSRRNFGVRYSALPNSDADVLRDFERVTLRNGADSFTWKHPRSGVSYTVRLTAPIKFSSVAFGFTQVSFSLCEV